MSPTPAIRKFDKQCVEYDVCEKGALILEHAHDSARAILKAFELVRGARGGKKGAVGTSTDEEQDLLRAMLVMASAGLDSMAKQLVRDALPYVVHDNDRARQELEGFVQKRLSQDFESLQEGRKARYVPTWLAAADLRERMTEEYVKSLTAGSLQSAEELRRIAAAFGLTQELITTDFQDLQKIFAVRNRIIHELDVNLQAARRNRNSRSKAGMIRDTNQVLAAGEDLLRAVDGQVAACQEE